jgi:hypothetical protein
MHHQILARTNRSNKMTAGIIVVLNSYSSPYGDSAETILKSFSFALKEVKLVQSSLHTKSTIDRTRAESC